MKVVLIDSYNFMGFHVPDAFRENGIDVVIESCRTEEEAIAACAGADALLLAYFKLSRAIIERLEHCRVIMRYGIGYENVDVAAATEKGIPVCNLPDYCIPEVATHTMALLLDTVRKTSRFNRQVRDGNWSKDLGSDIHRLQGLTLGLIGFGNIAQEVARYARPFGFRMVSALSGKDESVFASLGVEKVGLETLLATADIISIHVPPSPQTRQLIRAENIARMKDGVIIINTSRGAIVNEADLAEALRSGKVKAAGLDVFDPEPIRDPNHPFLGLDTVTMTPHIGYVSEEARADMLVKATRTIIAALQDELPYNTVNRNALLERSRQ